MKKKILMLLAFLLIFACQVWANSLDILSVDVIPSQPLHTQSITFSISGRAAQSSSWVDHDVFTPNGISPQLNLYVDYGMARYESYWNYSKQIQSLAPGTYSLEVRAFDISAYSLDYGTLQDTYTVNFTVVPEPATIALLGLGLSFLRVFSARRQKI